MCRPTRAAALANAQGTKFTDVETESLAQFRSKYSMLVRCLRTALLYTLFLSTCMLPSTSPDKTGCLIGQLCSSLL